MNTIITEALSRLRPGSTFLSIRGYQNRYLEVANYSLCFHVSYTNAIAKSIEILKKQVPTNEIQKRALEELIASYTNTLQGYNPKATSADAYERIVNVENEIIRGVKYHPANDELHLWGFQIRKKPHPILVECDICGDGTIHPESTRKPVNSRPLTIAKNEYKKLLPVERFHQFRLVPTVFKEIRVQNMSLTDEDAITKAFKSKGDIVEELG